MPKTHQKTKTRLYSIWGAIKARCNRETHEYYKYYGERNIKMCKEWSNDFKKFYDWANQNNYREGLLIDRINNDGNYEPQNCRWVTNAENCAAGRRRTFSNNKSGRTGVSWDKRKNKWRAYITIDKKCKNLGNFKNLEDAVKAREDAEIAFLYN